MSRLNKDIIAKCPECMKYVRFLMSCRPVRVVEIEKAGRRWVNHPCDVAHLYDPKKTYRFDRWGHGHEVIKGEWLP